ncbi:unnamed protein product [Prorocentrum cordatum]|uniref:Fe2OG dioxygenase domain-containing protein n=1 Tax=Prorocentrum cordatum TaxID=2364126 RepID=A0ABN9SJC2_9DINO|nr:unnamed protein product [Polarella glacialis]
MASAEAEIAAERALLAEGGTGGDEALGGDVPTVDLAAGDEAAAAALWEAATTVGFFQVVNHGIAQAEIDAAFSASAGFFARPVEEKERASPFAPEANSGYEFMKQVRPSTGTADQKESLQITARQGAMEGRWPQEPPGLRGASERLLDSALAVGRRILSLLETRACPKLAPGTLSRAHTLWGPQGQCTLRMLHYFPMELRALEALRADGGGRMHWRAGPHTDWCCATLLFQRPGGDGLECAPNPRVGGPWLRVPPQEGAIAVNIGDMLGRWSDGRLLSNLHRVRLPTPAECSPARPRYSIAVFLQADRDAEIRSEKHPTITAGDYILGRIRSNFASGPAPKRQKVAADAAA